MENTSATPTPPASILAVFDHLRQRYGRRLQESLGESEVNSVFREEVGGLPRAVKISKSPMELAEQEWRSLEGVKGLMGHPQLLSLVQYEQVLGHVVTVWEWADGGTLGQGLQGGLGVGRWRSCCPGWRRRRRGSSI